MRICREDQFILACCRSLGGQLLAEEVAPLLRNGLSWAGLIERARKQGIPSLLYWVIEAEEDTRRCFPAKVWEKLESIGLNALQRYLLLAKELDSILEAFERRGVLAIPFKGPVLAHTLYPNPAMRLMSDLDIWVRQQDMPDAQKALEQEGYRNLARRGAGLKQHPFHDVILFKAPVPVELHWQPTDTTFLPIDTGLVWQRARSIDLDGRQVLTLSLEDNLILLSIHLLRHYQGALRLLVDISGLLNRYGSQLDWNRVVRSCREWGAGGFVYLALVRVKSLLEAPVPAQVLRELKPSWWYRSLAEVLVDDLYFLSPPFPKLGGEGLALAYCLLLGSPRRMFKAYLSHLRMTHRPSIQGKLGTGVLSCLVPLFLALQGLRWSGLAIISALGRAWRRRVSF